MTFRESADLVKKTAQERGYTAPVLLDASGDVAGRVYGVWGPPTAYLIDRQGRLVGRIQGARDWSAPAARNLLRALVEETSLPLAVAANLRTSSSSSHPANILYASSSHYAGSGSGPAYSRYFKQIAKAVGLPRP